MGIRGAEEVATLYLLLKLKPIEGLDSLLVLLWSSKP